MFPNEGETVNDIFLSPQGAHSMLHPSRKMPDKGGILTLLWFSFNSNFDCVPVLEKMRVMSFFGTETDFSDMTSVLAFMSAVDQSTQITVEGKEAEVTTVTQVVANKPPHLYD